MCVSHLPHGSFADDQASSSRAVSRISRFQTAANRDAEQARRQSLPPPRRSSGNSFVRPDAAPPAKDAVPGNAVEAEPTRSTTVPPPANGRVRHSAPTEEAGHANEENGDKGKVERLKDKGKSLVEGVKDLVISGGASAKDANDAMAKEDQAGAAPIPAKTRPTKTATNDELVEGSAIKKNGASQTPAKSRPQKAISTPTRTPKSSTATPAGKSAPSVPTPSASSSQSRINPSAKSSTPGPKSPTLEKRNGAGPQATTTVTKLPSAAKVITPAPAGKSPPARTQRLTPALTGPARRTSSSHLSHPEPAPLRPQLTGTPSKPTASYLAKTRTPSSGSAHERRDSSSIGCATGSTASARARLSSGSPSPSPASSGIKSTPTRSALSASNSRLLQGTAASRAKAADVKSTPPKSSPKAKTATPKKMVDGTEKAGASDAGSDEPPRPPPGLRLGFAAAGMGKGGKTGKAYNEEQNEKLRKGEITGEEIVRQADQSSSNGAAPRSETSCGGDAAEEHAGAVEAAQSQIDATDPTTSADPSDVGVTASTDAPEAADGAAAVRPSEVSMTTAEHDPQPDSEDLSSPATAAQPEAKEKEPDLEEIPDL